MKKKLPKEAYGGVSGKDYVPYFTGKSKNGVNLPVLIIGIVLAIVFAASTWSYHRVSFCRNICT